MTISTTLSRRGVLLGILGVALVLRVGAAVGVQWVLDHRLQRDFLIQGDAEGYWELAKTIARGEDYAVHNPPRRVHRMPGFPAILAASIVMFGERLFAARLVLAGLGTLGVWLVYRVGRAFGSEDTGLIAAALAAVSPTFVLFSEIVLSETAFAVALLLNVLAAQRLYLAVRHLGQSTPHPPERARVRLNRRIEQPQRAPRSWSSLVAWSFVTGITVALGTMMRPSWILAGPIEAVLLAGCAVLGCRERRVALEGKVDAERLSDHSARSTLPPAPSLKREGEELGVATSSLKREREKISMRHRPFALAVLAGVLLNVGLVLALLPWGLRNRAVSGHFTLTTLWMGPSLYDGLNPRATGDSDMRFFDEDRLSDSLSEYAIDREYRRRAWEFAGQNPARTLELAWIKALRYWSLWPNAAQFDHWTGKLVVGAFSLPMLGLAVWGAVVVLGGWGGEAARREPRPPGILSDFPPLDPPPDPLPQKGGGEMCPPALADRIWSVGVLAGPVLYFALIHMVFVSSLRYRLPAEYPLLVLTAIGLQQIMFRRKQ